MSMQKQQQLPFIPQKILVVIILFLFLFVFFFFFVIAIVEFEE